jgi:hypothetical protein
MFSVRKNETIIGGEKIMRSTLAGFLLLLLLVSIMYLKLIIQMNFAPEWINTVITVLLESAPVLITFVISINLGKHLNFKIKSRADKLMDILNRNPEIIKSTAAAEVIKANIHAKEDFKSIMKSFAEFIKPLPGTISDKNDKEKIMTSVKAFASSFNIITGQLNNRTRERFPNVTENEIQSIEENYKKSDAFVKSIDEINKKSETLQLESK